MAAALPALALLFFVGIAAVAATITKVRCVDAARDAALAAARGQPNHLTTRDTAPPGAEITVTVNGDIVTATVRAPAHTLGHLPGLDVTATAVAAREPDPGGYPW